MVQVIAIGETMAMVTPVDASPLASAALFRVIAGGAESTVALYLQELGHATAWVSRVGADPLGRRVLEELRSHGVDVSWVYEDPAAPTGVYFRIRGSTPPPCTTTGPDRPRPGCRRPTWSASR